MKYVNHPFKIVSNRTIDRQIGLAVPIGDSSFREAVGGISAFIQHAPGWSLRVMDYWDVDWAWVRHKADGMLMLLNRPRRDERRLLDIGVPTVLLMASCPSVLPSVGVDAQSIGATAAEHLLARGLRRFAYLNLTTHHADADRERGFTSTVIKAGFECRLYRDAPLCRPKQEAAILAWVRSLPKPVGVMAFNDLIAQMLIRICGHAGIDVPDHVAVVGVDNCPIYSQLAPPYVTSVIGPFERVGYEAAAMLQHLMDGGAAPNAPLMLPAESVVARQSSDFLLTDDADLAAAVRFIRDNAHLGVGVKQLLQAVPMSRRRLEREFMRNLGRTPLHEFHRTRIMLAKELLTTTERPMPDIASRCGFSSSARLAVVFRKVVGTTPSRFRMQARQSGASRHQSRRLH